MTVEKPLDPNPERAACPLVSLSLALDTGSEGTRIGVPFLTEALFSALPLPPSSVSPCEEAYQ